MLLQIYSKAQESLEKSSYSQDREKQWSTNFNLLHNFKIPSLKTLQILGSIEKYKCRVQVFTFMVPLNTTFISTHGNQIQRSYSLHNCPLCYAHTGWRTATYRCSSGLLWNDMFCLVVALAINLKFWSDSRYMPSYLKDTNSKVHLNAFLT